MDKDFLVDKSVRYQGTVTDFLKWEGTGYIRPKDEGVAPGGSVWVDTAAIQTTDRFPMLLQDMEVEFGLMKWTERGETTLRATNVSLPGGAMVAVQEQEDLARDFVGGPGARYAGRLKFFLPAKGFGYVSLEDNIACDMELGLPQEVCVEATEVNCGGRRPKRMDNLEVEFGIFRGEKAQFMAHNMMLPGGKHITDENVLNREVLGDDLFMGTVNFWQWTENWGFITIDEGLIIPDRVQNKIEKMHHEATEKGKLRNAKRASVYFCNTDIAEAFCPQEGMRVFFNLYVDDKGAGATNVIHDVDSTTADTQ